MSRNPQGTITREASLAPGADKALQPRDRPPLTITLQDRLEHGNLTVDEVCALASRSRTAFYADAKAGLVKIHKMGRRSVIPGPVVKAYLAAVAVAV
jgi:hypothetical protein